MTPRPRHVTISPKRRPHGPNRHKTHDFLRLQRAWRTRSDETPARFKGEVVGPAVDVDIQFDPCEDCGCHSRLHLKSGTGHQRKQGRKLTISYKNTQCAGCGKLYYEVG